jgi:protein-S-isoprenylcysteine O-methyltransferase Ste14
MLPFFPFFVGRGFTRDITPRNAVISFRRNSRRAFPAAPFYNPRTMNFYKHDLEIVATAGLAIYGAYIGISGPWTPLHIAGAVLLVVGFIGWLTARLQIREFFAVKAEANGLVTTGIYSKIRNPIYFFGLVFFVGLVLYLSIPRWGLLIMLLIIVMQILRARNEARVLEAKFGDAYRQYRAKTWF